MRPFDATLWCQTDPRSIVTQQQKNPASAQHDLPESRGTCEGVFEAVAAPGGSTTARRLTAVLSPTSHSRDMW